MSDAGYNGWTNYPTWCVALWVDNDEGLYDERRLLVKSYKRDDGKCPQCGAAVLEHKCTDCGAFVASAQSRCADAVREWITESAPNLGASAWSDLLGAALSEVNWREIVGHWWEE